ncbi:hypothetical protein AVEN_103068-1 [Araneus ventricosus]|uniref:Uncharacterized protein n=1 Tax=Araneus ventricosus TaxID=182803 RepID=A0A4Y2B9I2_ARAVE|nr:hypothetical protein AVEN_103068-1 [Araneus ventricosus]
MRPQWHAYTDQDIQYVHRCVCTPTIGLVKYDPPGTRQQWDIKYDPPVARYRLIGHPNAIHSLHAPFDRTSNAIHRWYTETEDDEIACTGGTRRSERVNLGVLTPCLMLLFNLLVEYLDPF